MRNMPIPMAELLMVNIDIDNMLDVNLDLRIGVAGLMPFHYRPWSHTIIINHRRKLEWRK